MKKKILGTLASAVVALASGGLFALEDENYALQIKWEPFDSDISMSLSGSYNDAYSFTGTYQGTAMSQGRSDGFPKSTVSAGYTVAFVPPTGYSVSYYVVPYNISDGTEFTQYAQTYATSNPVRIDYSEVSDGLRYGVKIRNIEKTANKYTVTLNMQNGSGGTASVTATYNSAMPSITVPSRTGYVFGGYYTSSGGAGTQYYTSSGASTRKWDKTANTTLYAKWTAKTSVVSFDKQSGSGGTDSVTATYDFAMPAISVPSRTGYAFGGYYTSPNGGGVQYYKADGTSVRNWAGVAPSLTLYAYWTAKTYTVTLDRQNGSGGTASVVATYQSAMPAITVPTRTGYAFGGYYTEKNGAGTQYYKTDGTSARPYPYSGGITLYAKWTANSYTVNLRPQGGSGGTAAVSAVFGEMPPAVSVPVYAGYAFKGYFDAAGIQYYSDTGAPLRVWDKAAESELNARWEALSYTVTFDPQGGNGGTASVSISYNGSFSGHIEPPVREGYNFKGYFSAKNGNGTKFFDAGGFPGFSNWPVAEDVTLYAYWEGAKYTVRFHSNNAASASMTKTQAMVCGESAQLPAFSTFGWNVKGYNFLGWANSPAATAIEYSDGATVQDLANEEGAIVELYAVWEDYSYKVKFDANGGEGTMADQRIVIDTAAVLTASAFVRDGYSFVGWSSTNVLQSANATNWVEWADKAVVSNLSASVGSVVTLYAVWQPDTYKVYFDPGEEASFADASDAGGVEYIVGEVYGSFPPVVHARGKELGGWFVLTNGVWQGVGSSDIVPPLSKGVTNLVARWTVNALTEALRRTDEETLEFYASPAESWTAVDVDGVRVAQSKSDETSHDFAGNVVTTHTVGRGVLSFRWKVVSGLNLNAPGRSYLQMYLGVGTEEIARICGNEEKIMMSLRGSDVWTEVQVVDGFAEFSCEIEADAGVTNNVSWHLLTISSSYVQNLPGAVVDDVRFVPGEAITSTHKVPHSWLEGYFPELAGAAADRFEEKAESENGKTDPAGNPMYVWQDYVAGTDPTDLASVFKVGISVTNSVPYLWWTPDLGTQRVYRILSKRNLGDTVIQTNSVEEAEKEEWRTNRFFKVSVELP